MVFLIEYGFSTKSIKYGAFKFQNNSLTLCNELNNVWNAFLSHHVQELHSYTLLKMANVFGSPCTNVYDVCSIKTTLQFGVTL